MQIDRHELIQEIILREHIQKVLKSATNNWLSEKKAVILEQKNQEAKLRKILQNLIPKVLFEDMAQSKQDAALAFVRDALSAVIKTLNQAQAKFKDPEIQDGFIQYSLLALKNDFEETHAEEGEKEGEEDLSVAIEDELILQEFVDDVDGKLDIRIKASDDPMFIDTEKEEKEEEEEEDSRESSEEELYSTLSDLKKVGFRYNKENAWPNITKQIKRIHRMAIPDADIAKEFERWFSKNVELHGENTKEETLFKS